MKQNHNCSQKKCEVKLKNINFCLLKGADVKLKSKMKKFFLLIALGFFLSSNVMASCFTRTTPKYDANYKGYFFTIKNTCNRTITVRWELFSKGKWLSSNTTLVAGQLREVYAGPNGEIRNLTCCD